MKTNPAFVALFIVGIALLLLEWHAAAHRVFTFEKALTCAVVTLVTVMVGLWILRTK